MEIYTSEVFPESETKSCVDSGHCRSIASFGLLEL